ncbi:MAG: DUF1926 domain-containing protein [Methanophagales archaeon]|nr:DUF1926 domain-containing protein [Methanophagales archaeon]
MDGMSLHFILAVHNHQPAGNYPEVFEKIYSMAYLPFIEALEDLPGAKVALHYSGSLIDWFIEVHPEFLDRVRDLVRIGQVEIISGAFYEPILAILPDEDKVEQIKLFSERLKDIFSVSPTGLWLSERAWEPHIVKPICDAGLRYTFLDDAIFHGAGLREKDMFQYYVTEEQGRSLVLFPIPKRLRYLIPFEEPEETIDYLRNSVLDENAVAVLADDGEKFGAWPETYDLMYKKDNEKGWLHRFASLLEEHEVQMVTPSEYLGQSISFPNPNVYLPTASYSEMMEWALPVNVSTDYGRAREFLEERPEYAVFLRGGYWRNFLTKYEESTNLYRKMLLVSKKVHKMRGALKEEAKKELWKGQCNDAYWHGVFGGLYLSHLRAATYQHLIRAEKMADSEIHGLSSSPGHRTGWIEVSETDFDGDLKNEILVNTRVMNGYFSPVHGGTLFEWDFKPLELNLLDTLTRRPESYHKELAATQKGDENEKEGKAKVKSIHELLRAKDEALRKYLRYDFYRRVSFIDHFLPLNTRLKDVKNSEFNEMGDFLNQPYGYEVELATDSASIIFLRSGRLRVNGDSIPILLRKSITIERDKPEITLDYQIENRGAQDFTLFFGTELNLSPILVSKGSYFSLIRYNGSQRRSSRVEGAHPGIKSLQLVSKKLDVVLSVNTILPMNIWRFPVYTVSQSERGFERGLQAYCVCSYWQLGLSPGSSWGASLKYKLSFEKNV